MAFQRSGIFSRFQGLRIGVSSLFGWPNQVSKAQPCRSIAARMEPSKVNYRFVDEVERLDYYVPGGYHPVKLGDEFGLDRYLIVHKLGFGRSATTWLAEDRRQNRLVALKISTAESADRMHEMEMLSQLGKAQSAIPGKSIVQSLLDSFTFTGPNGTHRCLVTEPARVNLHEAKEAAYHRLLHLPAARAIVAQLILGVQFIHSQGIVHGDLHLANILLRFPPQMRDMTFEQISATAGDAAREQVIREDGAPLDSGVPSEVIVPIWLGLGSDEISLADAGIMISDFGEAFNPHVTPQFEAHTPLLLAPPEARFIKADGSEESLSFPGDIWTLACTIWDVFGKGPPFEAFPVSLDDVTTEQVEMLGRLPERWWSKWETRNNWFDDTGCKNVKEDLRQWYGNSSRDWDQRFQETIQGPRERRKVGTFSEEEKDAFTNMLKSMLVFEPSQRATIQDVMRCEWMQRWGLPEAEKVEST